MRNREDAGFGPSDDSRRWIAHDRGQALVRFATANVFIAYTLWSLVRGEIPDDSEAWFISLIIAVELTSTAFLFAAFRRPSVGHARRILAMAHDNAAVVFGLVYGGATMLPISAVLIWGTVANGLRFGRRYLAAAAAMALVGLAVVYGFTPYWREHPYVSATLFLIALLVPAYAYGALTSLEDAHAAALEANLAKSRFLAQASHDLRQPIHAISLFTACLRDAGLGPEERRMVDNIDKSLQGVSRLFRSLLDVSTLDSGKVRPRMEAVALGPILQDVVRQNSQGARWAGVELRLVATRAHVLADAGLIATMAQNVVSNALKYAPGRPVLIGCRRRAGTLSIEILDRGEGISPEALPRVFEEFFQVRKLGEKDIEGVGLGLSIVQRLAGLMGLVASIRSTVGRGTAVAIDGLKLVAAPAAPKPAPRAAPVAAMTGLKVLLVEDDESVLLATATLLEKWGCAVTPELRIPAAVGACDLVITDFDLGEGTTGADCIAQVRRLAGRDVPAVVMTGHEPKRVAQELGDADVPILSKPVRPAELRSIVMAQKLKGERQARESARPVSRAPAL